MFASIEQNIWHIDDQAASRLSRLQHLVELLEKTLSRLLRLLIALRASLIGLWRRQLTTASTLRRSVLRLCSALGFISADLVTRFAAVMCDFSFSHDLRVVPECFSRSYFTSRWAQLPC